METTLLEQVINAIPDAAFVVDAAMRIKAVNQRACDLVGLPRDEVTDARCFEVFDTNLCETGCPLKRAMKGTGPDRGVDVDVLDQDGFEIPTVASAAVLRDADGRMLGGVVILEDLSREREITKKLEGRFTFQDLISQDPKMHELFNLIARVAPTTAPVLIQGESGTGKELVARAIHHLSDRADGPFVALNCGALPDTLLESELFGYKKGAFTDAKRDKPGLFAQADNGTLFLDEIGDLPQSVQVKLLRVLQNGEYIPLGAVRPATSNCRILAATNQDLEDLMQQGRFRQDLFFRLNVISITIPPLRARKRDIPLLAEEFIHRYNNLNAAGVTGLSQAALKVLLDYDFPGNVRELENVIEHACILCGAGQIRVEHLPARIRRSVPVEGAAALDESEASTIRAALALHHGNREETAQYLGISRSTLWRKMKKYGLDGTKLA